MGIFYQKASLMTLWMHFGFSVSSAGYV